MLRMAAVGVAVDGLGRSTCTRSAGRDKSRRIKDRGWTAMTRMLELTWRQRRALGRENWTWDREKMEEDDDDEACG